MKPTKQTMKTWDGADLFYRAWLPKDRVDKALLLFHRGHEHSGRWQQTVETLNLPDVAVFAWDARGHGLSAGERGAANNLSEIVKDVDAFAQHISSRYGIAFKNMIVLAHSLAGVSVTAWVHDYAPPICAMILATAAFHVKLYLPFAIPALRLKQKLFGAGYVTSYIRSKMLTRDKTQAAAYEVDPLIFRQIAINVLLDLHDTAKRLVADAGAIHIPTLMLAAKSDWVVSLNAQREFFEHLSSPVKQMHLFTGARHSIFHETNREEVVNHVREFIADRSKQEAPIASFFDADRNGHTWREYERLKQGGGFKFAVVRAALKTAGRLSKGIDLGWRKGFDSGLSLDYVYKNEPSGALAVGRLVDKAYLNSVGWRGIRKRKANLEKVLQDCFKTLRAERRIVRILDIAAGPGRYVLETMRAMPEVSSSARLRDCKQENVDAARALAREFALENVVIERGDAFDRTSLAALEPKATIGIVSGLYELFPSNQMVLNSLCGLAAALEPNGYLIYTNQPWHPQVEFIARVLRNREGRPWVMRRRTTAEMDELIGAAGFEKIHMEVDEWGMFTVSIARRNTIGRNGAEENDLE
jgi:alpha-beta hydrolase superfamily lysophospholipase/SAM-dependent methyltransferase